MLVTTPAMLNNGVPHPHRGFRDDGGSGDDDHGDEGGPSPAKGSAAFVMLISYVHTCSSTHDVCTLHHHRMCVTTADMKGQKPVPDKQPVPEGKDACAAIPGTVRS